MQTIAMVLDSIKSESERRMFADAFAGFAAAWNASRTFVDRYQCTTLPQTYTSAIMTPAVSLSFCTVNEILESICALALLQYVLEKHNEMVEAAVRSQSRAQS